MASTKEYRDYILEQLSLVPGITCRPMMGEFLLYADGVLFGGIYDDRLLVKITPGNSEFGMSEALPYEGAKKMYLVDEVNDKEKLKKIVEATIKELRRKS
jgi:TfoX/Sxy family transcriptional regulator of competence genes